MPVHEHDERKSAQRRTTTGEDVVESMSAGRGLPGGVRLGGVLDPEETAADEVAARVVAQRPGGDLPSIIAAARQAGARVPDGVRVHQDSRASRAAAAMQAKAFTVGSDVYLGDSVGSDPQQRLQVLAHELAHTAQDRGHGHAGAEPVLQQWSLFKNKTAAEKKKQNEEAIDQAKESREDAEKEERQGAPVEGIRGATELSGTVGEGGADSTARDFGQSDEDAKKYYTDHKDETQRGTDGWGVHKSAVTGDDMDKWKSSHAHDANALSESGTVGGAGMDLTGGVLGALNAKGAKNPVDKTLLAMQAGSSLGKATTGTIKAGLQGAHDFGHGAGVTDSGLDIGGQAMDQTGGWLGDVGLLAGTGKGIKDLGSDTVDWFKGKNNFEKSDGSKLGKAKQVGLSMGRGLSKLGGIGKGIVGGVSKSANMAGQIAHSVGNTAAGNSAAVVGSTVGHAIAPLQMALGGVDIVKGGYNIFRKGQHRSRLTELKKGESGDNLDALNHLTEVAKKKQVRQGINIATGAAGVLGGALTASGFGAIPGVAIGAGVGAFKLGQLALRKGKQAGRDWADKYKQKDASKQSWLGKKVAGVFDTSKTTTKKNERNEKTAQTLMSMSGTTQTDALKTLGIHPGHLEGLDDAQKKELIIEKLKKRS